MSLKVVHFFFIVCSIALSAFFGFWCLQNYDWESGSLFILLGLLSLGSTGGLVYYLIAFLKKTKGFGFLVWLGFALLGFYPERSWGCSVCQFASPDSPLVMAIREGVWAILILLIPVLSGFLGLFLFWAKRDSHSLKKP